MKTPLLVALIIVALVGSLAGFYLYDRFNGGSTSFCSDPASISSHVYHPYRLQIVKSCITASGTVDRVMEEADGDVLPLKVSDGADALIPEKLITADVKSGQEHDWVSRINLPQDGPDI